MMTFKFDFNDIDLGYGACIIVKHLGLCIWEKMEAVLKVKSVFYYFLNNICIVFWTIMHGMLLGIFRN